MYRDGGGGEGQGYKHNHFLKTIRIELLILWVSYLKQTMLECDERLTSKI